MFNFKKHLGVCLNNAVWDIDNGNVLRLGEGKVITHAIRGFKTLTQEEIEKVYGKPPFYKHLKWPETNKIIEGDKIKVGHHWTMMGNFDRCKLAVVCKATELIDRGALKNKTFL
jgi:hypothetical protein